MLRAATTDLTAWIKRPERRPLVLRGARQVGKTWLVRDLAARSGRELIEINFERDPRWAACFADNDPAKTLQKIGLRLGRQVAVDRSLLFLDEIQEFGEGLAKLRWFAEECPALPVVAAGSLLEFTLRDHDFSMPVGRVSFYNLEPMTFAEYLTAHGQDLLLEAIRAFSPRDAADDFIHDQTLRWFDRYSLCGGMPGIVAHDVANPQGDTTGIIREAQRQLLATYRADFMKYTRRADPQLIGTVLASVAAQMGSKFILKQAHDARPALVKPAVELLCQARLCTSIAYSAGNGVPLGAETKEKFRKIGLLDVGLLQALMETPDLLSEIGELNPTMRSRVAEQLVTQMLRANGPRSGDPTSLYYWQREGGRPGEIDHLVQHQSRVIPIELKSGAAGSMKSLHQFVADKGLNLAVRIDRNPPSLQEMDVRTTQGDQARYRLVNLPIYLLGELDRVLSLASFGE
jgi:predicted AAA+ superfamily ATPase